MEKDEWMLTTAKEMFNNIVTSEGFEWDEDKDLEELAKTCVKCAVIIWRQVVL